MGSVLSILCKMQNAKKDVMHLQMVSPLDCSLDERPEQSDVGTDVRVVVVEGVRLPSLLALVHELHHQHTELIAL